MKKRVVGYLRDLSIRNKLIWMTMLTSGTALGLACAAFLLYEYRTYRDNMRREQVTVAHLIAESSVAPLQFDDARAVGATLAVLRRQPAIRSACIYTRGGRRFAEYPAGQAACPERMPEDGARFTATHLYLTQGIEAEGERVGGVFLESDLREMYRRLFEYGLIVIGVMGLSSAAALALSRLLQRLISGPLGDLAEAAVEVSGTNNYTLRVKRRGNDEVGQLVDRFNEMMRRVQDRDVALKQAQDELEDRVRERTSQLEAEIEERRRVEADLRAAKWAAEQSDRAKSAFLATMSHELRTPLNAIIGYSEMLGEDAEAEGKRAVAADLGKIARSGKHLLALIEDVLDLSKIEAGRMTIEAEELAVVGVLDEAVSTAEQLVKKNGNRLEVRCRAEKRKIVADGLRFRQSLLNLLSNACKFTQKGTVSLDVDYEEQEGKGWVLWHVRDTGIGISEEHQNKLFQSFSQVDSSATRRYEGTGLGLAISRRLCRMMGGDITVRSEAGEGSTFTIRIPAAEGAREPSKEAGKA